LGKQRSLRVLGEGRGPGGQKQGTDKNVTLKKRTFGEVGEGSLTEKRRGKGGSGDKPLTPVVLKGGNFKKLVAFFGFFETLLQVKRRKQHRGMEYRKKVRETNTLKVR